MGDEKICLYIVAVITTWKTKSTNLYLQAIELGILLAQILDEGFPVQWLARDMLKQSVGGIE